MKPPLSGLSLKDNTMYKMKTLVLVCAMALVLPGCEEDHPNPDDQRIVDHEVQTPLQKSYDTIDDCKKEFTTDGDCTEQTIIVNGQSQHVFISPIFYPWGAIYHPYGGWAYGYAVPPTTSTRIVSTALPRTVSPPNFSNSTAYSSSRISSLTTTRGGFGSTARAASSSSGGSSGG